MKLEGLNSIISYPSQSLYQYAHNLVYMHFIYVCNDVIVCVTRAPDYHIIKFHGDQLEKRGYNMKPEELITAPPWENCS
jgi:hypothetical protein